MLASRRGQRPNRISATGNRAGERTETDKLVADAFIRNDEVQAREALLRADVAFASVNDIAALATHPHLRRITVASPTGPVAFPAPSPILISVERSYGPYPASESICHWVTPRDRPGERAAGSEPRSCPE
jgi:itaconate CoA-transferase